MLLEYENRQARLIQEIPLHANLLETVLSPFIGALFVVLVPHLEAADEGFDPEFSARFANG